ncbi:MAG: tetratricopeptide repeat protein, partial [Microcoleus sp. C1-bin4]|nr:tetratricopeptide repeat protein [Microcoleus sp. C1-bin4]
AQTRFLAQAPTDQRISLLWRYCSDNHVLNWDSTTTYHFFTAVNYTADSLRDRRLASYAQYFQRCYRLLLAEDYNPNQSDYRSVLALLARTKAWAQAKGYSDIAASCDHFTGRVYFRLERYGPAFEHLLKAQEAFQEIGYDQVPYAAGYFYNLGSNYYQFEDFDKALASFLAATRYPFYISRMEINTFNAIGLIYARQKNWNKAMVYYRKTIARAAAFHDTVWVGIGAGNLGQAWLAQSQHDSALFYLRCSYKITSNIANGAPEDAAYCTLALATVFVRQQQPDSARYYLESGRQLARGYIRDAMGNLAFRRRLLPVLVELNQAAGDYKTALHFSNSLGTIKDSLQHLWDARILSQAANKVEVERYQGELKLLESQKKLTQLRFYGLVGT